MLAIENLSFGYERQNILLSQINLDLHGGHIYGLLGKNGAGKSTLLKNITGLTAPVLGTCKYYGVNVSARPVSVLSNIFFVSEDIFLPSLTAREFVAHTAPFYPGFSRDEFYRCLLALDVDKNMVMDRQSFGQQKKIMIAFGLATNTNLLILDEPTNGLDIPSKTQFRKLIASAQTESRCILISTHQVRDLDSLIDTLLILHNREIIINQSLDEIVEKLSFYKLPDTTGLEVLYEEVAMPGKSAILPNRSGELSKPDIELLFNAVISGNRSVLEILKTS